MWPFRKKQSKPDPIDQLMHRQEERQNFLKAVPVSWDPGIAPQQYGWATIIDAVINITDIQAFVSYKIQMESTKDTAYVWYPIHNKMSMLLCKELGLAMSQEELPAQVGKRFWAHIHIENSLASGTIYNKVRLYKKDPTPPAPRK